ncbi:hypothetical protein GCM10023093_24150 [Nemorincola caseinilytica]|uniref:Secretion system C-terminal sorting domain-containing protein n=1 Tax=Nemorincola caseinilytica TaxID=2054315 RepID=A0ABP8NI96_9BACT
MSALSQTKISRIMFTRTTSLTTPYNYSSGSSLVHTPDGGYYINSSFFAPFIDDWGGETYLTKTDSLLRPQWKMYYGGAHQCLPDGSVIMASGADMFGSGLECEGSEVIRMDMTGDTKWIGKFCSDDDKVVKLHATSIVNGRIRLLGHLRDNIGWGTAAMLCEIDTMGHLLSSDTLSLPHLVNYAHIERMFSDDSGNAYLLLTSVPPWHNPYTIVKMRPNNTIVWSYEFQLPYVSRINAMASFANGDVVFAGDFRISATDHRTFAIKMGATGICKWQKVSEQPCHLSAMRAMPDGHLLLSAVGQPIYLNTVPYSSTYTYEYPLILTDSAMHVKWARNMTPGSSNSIQYTGMSAPYIKSPNEWVFAATTRSPNTTVVFTTDSLGSGLCSTIPYEDPISFRDTLFTLLPVPVSIGHYTPLLIRGVPDTSRVMRVKYVDGCSDTPPTLTATTSAGIISIFPNPADHTLHIASNTALTRLELIDMTGRTIATQHPGSTGDIDVAHITNGNYLLKIYTATSAPVYHKITILH